MRKIISYDRNTEAQFQAYIDTLHPFKNDGRYVIMFGDKSGGYLIGKTDYLKKHFMKRYEDNKYDNIFCALNATNKYVTGDVKERNEKNIYNYDTIMFDLDAHGENLSGFENQLVDEFFVFCEDNCFPVPNAFSYSGGGGVHLYYNIDPCYPGLGNAIKTLKYIMADKLRTFVDNYLDAYGMEYSIDTRVFDKMRLDRVPGTMNPKTGRMCEFFKVDIPRYTFKMLLNYNDDIDLVNWDKALQAAKNNYFYGKNKKTKLVISSYTKSKKRAPTGRKNPNYREKSLNPMLQKRIDGFFKLAEMGYGFRGARETSCFAMRQICRNLGLSREEEIKLLHKLNDCFYQPFDEKFLLEHTDSNRTYHFTNEALAANLGLDVTDELFVKAFQPKEKVVKEYGLDKPALRRAKSYIAIANEMLSDPYATVKELSSRMSRIIVTHRPAALEICDRVI